MAVRWRTIHNDVIVVDCVVLLIYCDDFSDEVIGHCFKLE